MLGQYTFGLWKENSSELRDIELQARGGELTVQLQVCTAPRTLENYTILVYLC